MRRAPPNIAVMLLASSLTTVHCRAGGKPNVQNSGLGAACRRRSSNNRKTGGATCLTLFRDLAASNTPSKLEIQQMAAETHPEEYHEVMMSMV